MVAVPETTMQMQNQFDVKFCVPVQGTSVLVVLCYLGLIAVMKFQYSEVVCIVHHMLDV